MANDIEWVSDKFLRRLFDSPGETYEPRGKFITADIVDGKAVFIAVNNVNGDALTEEFETKNRATIWLHGGRARNRFGEIVGGGE